MSSDEQRYIPQIVLTVPPNIDSKTWAEVRLKEIEVQRETVRVLEALAKDLSNTLKDYYLRKIPRTTIPAYTIAGLVVLSSTILTWYGKLGGETYAFLMGTIIGYIISLLSR